MATFIVTLICLTLIYLTQSTDYHVDPSNTAPIATRDGLSWSTPFISLEEAINAITTRTDSIWLIGNKTYIPATSQRDACFNIPRGTKIYGGFDGTESNINQRPNEGTAKYNKYLSIISGDIGIINDNSDNCYHVITYNIKLTMDRVIIQDGNADYNEPDYHINQINTLHRYGGGIITSDSTQDTELNLNSVSFYNNQAYNGGVMWVTAYEPTSLVIVSINNCVFENNTAVDIDGSYSGGYGGSIYMYRMAAITITNSEFVNNYAMNRGGAVYQDYGGILSVTGTLFEGNEAGGYGGALFSEDRNSQTLNGTRPRIVNSSFVNNSAQVHGGAIAFYNFVYGTLERVDFEGNHANSKGGAIAIIDSFLTETDSIYDRNTANEDALTNDHYNETEFEFTSMDTTITKTGIEYLSELRVKYLKYSSIMDVYPYIPNQSQICYVDADNIYAVNPTGTSWTDAYITLQECLDQVSLNGDGEIWVAEGTYTPTIVPDWKQNSGIGANNNKQKSFVLYDNIRVYGGFDGTEIERSERDFAVNPTYLSGKLSVNNGNFVYVNQILQAADNTIIDGFIFTDAGYDNFGSGTIRRRLANSISVQEVLSSTSTLAGAGIHSNSTTITVVNTVFYKLFSKTKGGAVYCIGQQGEDETNIKAPTFINVAFVGNRANIRGGAISADVSCNFKCNHCLFEENACGKKGGGIYLDFDSDPVIGNSEFNRNYAHESGGCLAEDGQSLTTFTNTRFTNNSARMEGGCLYAGSGVKSGVEQGFRIQALQLASNEMFIDNYITDNNPGQADIYSWPYGYIEVTESRKTPNFLIFMIDDIQFTQSWGTKLNGDAAGVHLASGDITYYDIPTPNFDAFIDESVVIPRSYSNPKCSPSRYSLLTGRVATRNEYGRSQAISNNNHDVGMNVGVPQAKIWGDDGIYNMPNVLKQSSTNKYYSGMVGKWHLMTSDSNGYNMGCHDLTTQPNATVYEKCIGIVREQGFDFVDAFYTSNIDTSAAGAPYSHNPEWMVSESMKFIDESVAADNPFFLYFAPTLTHGPPILNALWNYTAAETPKGVLTGDEIPNNTGMKNRSEILDEASALKSIHGWKWDGYNQAAGAIWIDDAFRALMDYLKSNNLYEDTFIVLMNDHGMGSKNMLFEQGSRIINAIRYPPSFGTNGHMLPDDFIFTTTDIPAAVFDLAGVNDEVSSTAYVMDGKNFVPDIEEYVYNTENGIIRDYDIDPPSCCEEKIIDIMNSHVITTKKYKYFFRATTQYQNNGERHYPDAADLEQLYDMEFDPDEQVNLLNGLQLNNTYMQDILFEFRIKMWDYILHDVCLSSDKSNCIVPTVSYIPSWSSWDPLFTCDKIVNVSKVFNGVKKFNFNNEHAASSIYRDSLEQEWLLNNPNQQCGTDFQTDIEYLYDVTKKKKKLTVDMKICCDGSFGPNYPIPTGFVGNDVYTNNNPSIWEDIETLDTIGLKEILVINIAIIICIVCIIGGYFYRNKKKHQDEISKLQEVVEKNEKEKEEKAKNDIELAVEPQGTAPTGTNNIQYQYAVHDHSHDSHYTNNHSAPSSRRNSFSATGQSTSHGGFHQAVMMVNNNNFDTPSQRGQQGNLASIPHLRMGYPGMSTESNQGQHSGHSGSNPAYNNQSSGSNPNHNHNHMNPSVHETSHHQGMYSKGSLATLHHPHSTENNSANNSNNSV